MSLTPEDDAALTLSRRSFLRTAAVAGVGAAVANPGLAAPADPRTASGMSAPATNGPTTSDIVIETLIRWDVRFVFGVVGDGINPLIEALRKRQDRIRYIGVRHEEAAAFMACGYAKLTGKLGACLATTGPGAIHLLNGLYDAALDGAPVIALTGTTFHDLVRTRFQQDIDTTTLMSDVAVYNAMITGPRHAAIAANLACRKALAARGVAHLTIPKDLQRQELADDKPSTENHDLHTSSSWTPSFDAPDASQIRAAADILNTGTRVAILAGQGARDARAELASVAERLGAPIAKSLLGKALLPDDSTLTTGGIGHLGTFPSKWAMSQCDALLIVGSTMPWNDYYPTAGQARAVQIDIDASRIGLRYPVDVGIAADARATLAAMLPLIAEKSDRRFLLEAQSRMREWNALLETIERDARTPMRPQAVVRALSDALDKNAVVTLDCGANTHFAGRHLRIQRDQSIIATGMLATMSPGLPYAIAAKLAQPTRQVVAVVGDGGFAMSMAELSTAVRLGLAIKVLVLRNDVLGEVQFEQKEIGNPVFGCELGPIDFVAFAKACGATGVRCANVSEAKDAIADALALPGAALIEAIVDPAEPPLRPEELVRRA